MTMRASLFFLAKRISLTRHTRSPRNTCAYKKNRDRDREREKGERREGGKSNIPIGRKMRNTKIEIKRKRERERNERIFRKKDFVRTRESKQELDFVKSQPPVCMRMIAVAVGGRRTGEITSTERGIKPSSQIFTVSERNRVS